MVNMDLWYIENLVCPIDYLTLEYLKGFLVCSCGRKYPVIDGTPIMLLDEADQTLWVASASIKTANANREITEEQTANLYLETLGISEKEREGIIELAGRNNLNIDPVVAYIVAATNGLAYKHLLGNLDVYPIPEFRLPKANGSRLLDIGCNWGRWSVAATRKGYTVVGIDPSLGAIMAAKRVAVQMGLSIKYVVADARYLPFKESYFDTVFSYSVLQHFSKENVKKVLSSANRVLKTGGTSLIQMANFLGIRSLQHQFMRGWRKAKDFEVRYWSVPELKETFRDKLGDTTISTDCYFGLGLQKNDLSLMPAKFKLLIALSEVIRKISDRIGALKYLADSVYVTSHKQR